MWVSWASFTLPSLSILICKMRPLTPNVLSRSVCSNPKTKCITVKVTWPSSNMHSEIIIHVSFIIILWVTVTYKAKKDNKESSQFLVILNLYLYLYRAMLFQINKITWFVPLWDRKGRLLFSFFFFSYTCGIWKPQARDQIWAPSVTYTTAAATQDP